MDFGYNYSKVGMIRMAAEGNFVYLFLKTLLERHCQSRGLIRGSQKIDPIWHQHYHDAKWQVCVPCTVICSMLYVLNCCSVVLTAVTDAVLPLNLLMHAWVTSFHHVGLGLL